MPLVVALPLLAAIAVGAVGRRGASRWGVISALVPLAIAFLIGTTPDGTLWVRPWAPDLGLRWAFRLDAVSRPFALLVATVGLAVFPYAGRYLKGDPRLPSFLATLLAFTAGMLGIVLADDLGVLFVCWEVTTLTSFLLISYDRKRLPARRAAQQAFLVTFAGGLCLLAAIALLYQATGTLRMSEMPDALGGRLTAIAALVMLAAFAKSAQAPFHFWLPNAMEAPTPVSAYLHSATMVQAGIYLLARFQPWLMRSEIWHPVLLTVGGVTVAVSAVALLQRDLKRTLAYATIGALGMMVAALSTLPMATVFGFFLAHGLYKAALFLTAGNISHATHTLDLTRLRGLGAKMPVTRVGGLVAAFSMASLPLSAGFAGKEAMLEAAPPMLRGLLVLFGALSVAVAFRVGVRPFVGLPSEDASIHEGPRRMTLPVLGLAAAGLVPTVLAPRFGIVTASPVPHLSAALGWSALSWTLGLGLAAIRLPAHARDLPSLDTVFWRLTRLGLTLGHHVVGRIQHGYLNGYLRAVFMTLAGLVGVGIWRMGRIALPLDIGPMGLIETVVAVTVVVGTLGALLMPSRLASVAVLGIVGYGVAILYVWYGAPDLAMTQIAVETLTLILFVFTFYRLPRPVPRKNTFRRTRDGIVAVAVGTAMAVLTFIASCLPQSRDLSEFFSARALPEGKGHNIVNVILVDFRGFDTLGEITVLTVAGLGVFSLLRMPRKGGNSSLPSS